MIIRTKWNKKWRVCDVMEFADKTQLGECNYEHRTITIREGHKDRVWTLVHEIIHAIDGDNEIGLTEDQVMKLEWGVRRLLTLSHKNLHKLMVKYKNT